MRFRRTVEGILILISLTSCSWLKDQPKASLSFQNENINLDCLKPTPVYLHELFEGSLTNSESDQNKVKFIWSCLDKALNVFTSYTTGKDKTGYEASELQTFANRFLPEDQSINNEFLKSIFTLKTSVLGGSEERLTRTEISQLRTNLRLFGDAILPLSPFLKVLLSPQKFNETERSKALVELKAFSTRLAEIFATSIHPMNWETLSQFAFHLEQYIRVNEVTSLTMIYEQVDILRYMKILLVGGSSTQIEQDKWKPILVGLSSTIGTLVTAKTPLEIIENIRFELSSTAEEQQAAIDALGKSLKSLIQNQKLKTINKIKIMADYWIKAKVILEILIPFDKTPISLVIFFENEAIRKAENQFAEAIFSKTLSTILNKASLLLHQLNLTFSKTRSSPPQFSMSRIQSLLVEYRPLFLETDIVDQSISLSPLFLTFHTLMTQKESDIIYLSDLEKMIIKIEHALENSERKTNTFPEKFELFVDILKCEPKVEWISREVVEKTLPFLESILVKSFKIDLPKHDYKNILGLFFSLKSLLWGSPDDRITVDDLDHLTFIFKNIPRELSDLPGFFRLLENRFKTKGHTPSINLELFAKSGIDLPWFSNNLMYLEVFKKLRPKLNGNASPLVSLHEVSDLIQELLLLQKIALSKKAPIELGINLIKEILKLKGTLEFGKNDFSFLVKDKTLNDLIGDLLFLKSGLIGTSSDYTARKDFEVVLRVLLALSSDSNDMIQKVFAEIESANGKTAGRINIAQLNHFIGLVQSKYPSISSLKRVQEISLLVLEFKKSILGDRSDFILVSEAKDWYLGLTSAKEANSVGIAKNITLLLLQNLKSDGITKTNLKTFLARIAPQLTAVFGKEFDLEKTLILFDRFFVLKSVIFASNPEVLSRSELSVIYSGIDIYTSDLTQAKKNRKYVALLRKNLKSRIQIDDLVSAVLPIIETMKMSAKIPFKLNSASIKRLKLLMVGGSSESISPRELEKLVLSAASNRDPRDLIQVPKIKIDVASLKWIENLLVLLIESGKEFGLNDAYQGISNFMKTSGIAMKVPLKNSLYGIWYHVLEGKTGKPARVNALSNSDLVKTAHFKALLSLLQNIREQLQDLAEAYGGSPDSSPGVRRDQLLARLHHEKNLKMVRRISPLLKKSAEGLGLHFSSPYRKSGVFEQGELAYRVVMEGALRFLFARYHGDDLSPRLNKEEFTLLLSDIQNVMLNFGLLYRTSPPEQVAGKQIKAVNLFTQDGNGDEYLDVEETAEFMTISFGTSISYRRLIAALKQNCTVKENIGGLKGFAGECVVNYYFKPENYRRIYGETTPGMVAMLESLSPTDRNAFAISTLGLTKPKLYSENSTKDKDDDGLDAYFYTDFDIDVLQSLNAIHPMIENVFEIMDGNRDESISLNEALRYFPRFCPEIKQAALGKVDGTCDTEESSKRLKALYGYLLVKKTAPGADFLLWQDSDIYMIGNVRGEWDGYLTGKKRFTPLTRYDLFKILSGLAPN